MKKYKLIIVEGIDGSGKTTLIDNYSNGEDTIINDIITGEKYTGKVLSIKGISSSPIGKRIRKELAKPEADIDYLYLYQLFTEDSLYIFSRLEGFKGIVIMDRSPFSQACYQTKVRPQSIIIKEYFRRYPRPDYLIYLDVSPTEAMKRLKSRKTLDGFENKEKLIEVYENYKKMIPILTNKYKINVFQWKN